MSERAAAQSHSKDVIRLESRTADQTMNLGIVLGRNIAPATVLTLSGSFGAGKTTIVQGLGQGLGIRLPIVSPSFALVNEYLAEQTGARATLFHADLYRLQNLAEAYDLGLDEYIDRQGVLAIEWPDVADSLLPVDRLSIDILDRESSRDIEIAASGPCSRTLLEAVAKWRLAIDPTQLNAVAG